MCTPPGRKLLKSYEEMSHQTEAEQRRLARAQASTDLVAGGFAGVASLACYGMLWWLLADGSLPLAVGGTAVLAIRASTARLTSLVQQVNRLYEELLFLTDTEDAIALADGERHPHDRRRPACPCPSDPPGPRVVHLSRGRLPRRAGRQPARPPR